MKGLVVTKKEKRLLKEWKKSLKKRKEPIFKSLYERVLFWECLRQGIVRYPALKREEKSFKNKLKSLYNK
ncbi:MAG: hypothetical protein RBR23_01505 [Arcobacteraceae bacterium]|jgi:hypothetical protein|nr:hypothetical protein [Arcobacteraceae bacterium]